MSDHERRKRGLRSKTSYTNLQTIDGMITEPLNPSFMITKDYVIDKRGRQKIYSRFNTIEILKLDEIKNLYDFLSQ